MTQFLLGSVFAILFAAISYRAGVLDSSGAIASCIMGTIVFGIGGFPWAILVLAFFTTSSLLSRFAKSRVPSRDYAKGSDRDSGQVFANGAVATAFALIHYLLPTDPWPWIGFSAALAAVNADTWATELGAFSQTPPRLITDLRQVVDRGTSGGITLVGTVAAAAGAGLIGTLSALSGPSTGSASIGILVTFAGFCGALFDSFLGATVQAMYFCPTDQRETEQHPTHRCGTPTRQIRGWRWLNNDGVNFACSAVGAAVALGLSYVHA